MFHKRKLGEHFYKLWCPEIHLKQSFVFGKPFQKTKILDLHGFTLNEAYIKTLEFIEKSSNNGFKKINIITGASGEIKKEFATWISNNKSIQSFSLKNKGEYEIFLKRKK